MNSSSPENGVDDKKTHVEEGKARCLMLERQRIQNLTCSVVIWSFGVFGLGSKPELPHAAIAFPALIYGRNVVFFLDIYSMDIEYNRYNTFLISWYTLLLLP